MKRSIVFAKRNVLELLKNPINLFFCLCFPIVLFLVLRLIVLAMNVPIEQTPMFAVDRLVPSICVFSFTFSALNISVQISKDRTTSFLDRLCVSPMTPIDFFLGYLLPMCVVCGVQVIFTYIIGFIFGLKMSVGLLYCFISLIPVSILYICIGILIGSIFNEKSCGGICSIIANAVAILGGMFFPLTEGTFKNVLGFLPFLPSIEVCQNLLISSTVNMLKNSLVVLFYLAIIFAFSIFAFNKNINSSKK